MQYNVIIIWIVSLNGIQMDICLKKLGCKRTNVIAMNVIIIIIIVNVVQ